MKNIFIFFALFSFGTFTFGQEILATVQVNHSQLSGSNTQTFKSLEKNLQDFINNTSWTGKKLQSFEKINANFAIVLTEKPSQNSYRGTLVVQASRPVFNTQYQSPLLSVNDTNFSFEYIENENLIFNERQFSGKNLIDVISFYVYTILGYDADSFQALGGQPWFEKSLRIYQNAQSSKYGGWSQMEGPKTRGSLITGILDEQNRTLRQVFYTYHRAGLDNLADANQVATKRNLAEELLKLKLYESNFQMNYPVNVFIETKKEEIFQIFSNGSNGTANISGLRNLMMSFSPRDSEQKWKKWK